MVGYDLPIVALDLARSEQIIDVYYLRGGGVLDTGLFNNFQAVLVKAIALAKSATGNSHTIHHMAAPGIPPGENLGYTIVPTLGRSGRTLERVTMFASTPWVWILTPVNLRCFRMKWHPFQAPSLTQR